jgi:hypothetical protein
MIQHGNKSNSASKFESTTVFKLTNKLRPRLVNLIGIPCSRVFVKQHDLIQIWKLKIILWKRACKKLDTVWLRFDHQNLGFHDHCQHADNIQLRPNYPLIHSPNGTVTLIRVVGFWVGPTLFQGPRPKSIRAVAKNGLQGSHADAIHVFDARPKRGHAVAILPISAPRVEGTPPKPPAPARVSRKHLNASLASLLARLSSSLALYAARVRQSALRHGCVAELLGHHRPTTMPSPCSTASTIAPSSLPSVPFL